MTCELTQESNLLDVVLMRGVVLVQRLLQLHLEVLVLGDRLFRALLDQQIVLHYVGLHQLLEIDHGAARVLGYVVEQLPDLVQYDRGLLDREAQIFQHQQGKLLQIGLLVWQAVEVLLYSVDLEPVQPFLDVFLLQLNCDLAVLVERVHAGLLRGYVVDQIRGFLVD